MLEVRSCASASTIDVVGDVMKFLAILISYDWPFSSTRIRSKHNSICAYDATNGSSTLHGRRWLYPTLLGQVLISIAVVEIETSAMHLKDI
jgi:hypothetical protein